MSMLSLCINEVYQQIPEEILSFVFMEMDKRNYYVPVNLDARIIEEVINKRIMPDLNVEYAVRINVPLNQCDIERITAQDWIVTVPPELTNGRKIITVLGVNFIDMYATSPGGFGIPTSSAGALLVGAQKMANATGGIAANYEVKCEMISGNAFRIRRTGFVSSNCAVELIIENDPQLNNIPITAADYIKKLVVLATKAYIYRKSKIRIGQAKLDGGSELGAFMEFIDSYADANELYLEELKSASRIQWLGSEEMKYDFMQMIMTNLV